MLHLSVIATRLLAIVILIAAAAGASAFAPGTEAEIRERIAPFGQLRVQATDEEDEGEVVAQREPRDAEAIYDQFCGTCHIGGIAGAPRMTAEAWEPRIAEGMEALYATTFNGRGAMPPRGTCFDCTDEELIKTVDWMVESVQ
ncbi:MAG: cytochrome c5 family protein [Gammaproteobacteria bacterium]|nr:cytochrome c5 family protein [Gammaproteobacteria bacterium]